MFTLSWLLILRSSLFSIHFSSNQKEKEAEERKWKWKWKGKKLKNKSLHSITRGTKSFLNTFREQLVLNLSWINTALLDWRIFSRNTKETNLLSFPFPLHNKQELMEPGGDETFRFFLFHFFVFPRIWAGFQGCLSCLTLTLLTYLHPLLPSLDGWSNKKESEPKAKTKAKVWKNHQPQNVEQTTWKWLPGLTFWRAIREVHIHVWEMKQTKHLTWLLQRHLTFSFVAFLSHTNYSILEVIGENWVNVDAPIIK